MEAISLSFATERIAQALFGDSRILDRFNMNGYKERHELARLIGVPPGFTGHEQQGALFRYVESHPQGLILLDEMKKDHPEIQDYFLQILDKGETRDPLGVQVDNNFGQTIE
jgi:ATP-dependent Clp protease ATP-binding subunit ClpE